VLVPALSVKTSFDASTECDAILMC